MIEWLTISSKFINLKNTIQKIIQLLFKLFVIILY